MKSKRYTRALALLIAAFVCFAAHEAKAQELSTDQIYERATYIIVQQESERREYDTIRWRHNLRLMLGAPSYVQVAFLDSDFGDIDVDGIYARPTASDKLAQYRYYTTPTYMVPPISFEYNHYVNKWFTVGGKAIFSALYREVRHIQTDEKLYSDGSYSVGLILNLRFEYMRREYVQLYSAFGAGFAARFEYDRGILIPMYDATYFGIVVGKNLYGFAEVGAGLSGSIRAGLGFRF